MKYILEAHRGVGTDCPEETISAFRAAIAQGYGMIELDTKFTSDNKCVLLHDRTVNRTGRMPDGTAIQEPGAIAEMTLQQAQELDFGIWKDPAFAGEKIPTLEQVLTLAMGAAIPLKFDNVLWSHTPEQQQIFFDTVIDMGAGQITEITCSKPEQIRKTLEKLPQAGIHYDGPAVPEVLAEIGTIVPKEQLTTWIRFDNKITAWCRNPPVTAENAAMVKQYGKLGVWLLTEETERKEAVERYGADIIETDGTLKP
ncbi:MAG: hypothetical protein IJX14_08515 [Clostridia bacterium]|nr:hypothetical protein [Clostridia bacterium]